MGSTQPRDDAAAAAASTSASSPADASIRSRHHSSLNSSSSHTNTSAIEKAQRIAQRDMLRAGPREQATAIGQETDPNELMEMGTAGAHQRKSSAYSAALNSNNTKKGESLGESDTDDESKRKHAGSSLSPQDQRAMVLLVLLCELF